MDSNRTFPCTSLKPGLLALVALAVLTFLTGPLTALDPARSPDQYVNRSWTRHDGLPQSSVTSIIQDSDGYLWLGTFGGLARFDGVRFETFLAANEPGLPGDRIIALMEDSKDRIWIGTENAGAAFYEDGDFHRIAGPEGATLGFAGTFAETPDGAIWIGGEKGLLRVDGESVTWLTDDSGSPLGEATALLVEDSEDLWIGTRSGLFLHRDGSLIPIAERELGDHRIVSIVRSRDGRLVIASSAGVHQFQDPLTTAPIPLSPSVALAALEDSDGSLWLAGNDLTRLRISESGRLATEQLAIGGARALFEDREGSLWVGSDTGGLIQLTSGRAISYPMGDQPTPAVPIIDDGEGGLWVGLPCHGLAHFVDREVVRTITVGPSGGPCIWSLLLDRSGRLWAGTFGDGLYYLEGSSLVRVPDSGKLIKSLWQHEDGRLFAGTGNGLHLFDRSGFLEGPIEGTAGLEVVFIAQSPEGDLWLATNQGVRILSDSGTRSLSVESGLASNAVRAIHFGARGVVWIGTYGGGLNRLVDGELTHIGRGHGLPDNTISRILEDADGDLWVTSNGGVFQLDTDQLNRVASGAQATLDVDLLDEGDGLASSECNGGGQPAGVVTDSGDLWVPTIAGIAAVDTRGRRSRGLPPPVRIERVLIDGLETAFEPGPLELPPGADNFEIHYTALSFVNPERVRFRYQLTGPDVESVDAGTRRVAYYSHLPPGDYEFRVEAIGADGVRSTLGASLVIRVAPSLSQTWWFRVLGALVLLAGGAGLARWQIRRVAHREHDLATRVAERTAYLEQLAEVTRKLNASLVLEEVLNQLFESFRDILPYDRIGCSLLSRDGQSVRTVWARSSQPFGDPPTGSEVPLAKTTLGRVLATGQPRIIDDLPTYLKSNPRSVSIRWIVEEGYMSSLTLPLLAMGRPVGFLFFSSREVGTYAHVHTEFFQQVAGSLAQIVEKSQLYSDLLEARTRLERANIELGRQASLDGLTGIPNRRVFEKVLEEEWRRAVRVSGSLSLLMIDIDRFKVFNDQHGHLAGDECLRRVASTLKKALRRAGDSLARYGGEEFVVVLPGAEQADLEQTAEMLRTRVEELPIPLDGRGSTVNVTISLGGATITPAADGRPEDLISAADQALYAAKGSGRNRYCQAGES